MMKQILVVELVARLQDDGCGHGPLERILLVVVVAHVNQVDRVLAVG
jgi:hypothetical protein